MLIVEDDPMVAQINRKYVDSIEGFKVAATAENGEVALQILEKQTFDLVVLDIYMPKVDGLRLLKEIREKKMMVDIILVTAAKEVENIDEVLKLGAIDYLIKPFEYERFKKSLLNYRERYSLLKNKKIIQQQDIDSIMERNNTTAGKELQKGLHERTLIRVRDFIISYHKQSFTCDEVSVKLGISNVTLRRYLEYLSQTGDIKVEIEYGNVGRPCYVYSYIQSRD